MLIFGASFSKLQYLGIIYLFIVYTIQGIKFTIVDMPKIKAKDQRKKDVVKSILA